MTAIKIFAVVLYIPIAVLISMVSFFPSNVSQRAFQSFLLS